MVGREGGATTELMREVGTGGRGSQVMGKIGTVAGEEGQRQTVTGQSDNVALMLAKLHINVVSAVLLLLLL